MIVTDITRFEQGDKNEQVKLLCENILGYTYYESREAFNRDYKDKNLSENIDNRVVYILRENGAISLTDTDPQK